MNFTRLLSSLFSLAFGLSMVSSSSAGIIISQYYEGTSNNKWIEITNVGTTSIDLAAGNFKLSGFQNANRELWKTGNSGSINGGTFSLNGVIAAGASLTIRNNGATLPAYALPGSINAGTASVNFNGDDSVVLWTGTSYSFSNVVDVFGVTSNSFVDTSYVRNSNILTGTNTDFNAAQWTQYTLNDVNVAAVGTTERLGQHLFSAAVPEPTSLCLGATGILLTFLQITSRRQRRQLKAG